VIIDQPLHPYTRLLIASLPEVGVRYADKRLVSIPGRPPSLLDPPSGCRFRARCPFAFERCADEPPFEEVRPGHFVACWLSTQASGHGAVPRATPVAATPVAAAPGAAAPGAAARGVAARGVAARGVAARGVAASGATGSGVLSPC
jgi:oligopeptide/dipeptide ABC transporter ATP-binding protein